MAMILTLGFDSRSFARLAPLRELHFPAARNFLPVHVTLFQQLPDAELSRLLGDLAQISGRTPPAAFRATRIFNFSGGAAVDLTCPPAMEVQDDLRRSWSGIITDSDDRARKLHVTIQNKVDRKTARATQSRLRDGFTPWEGLFDRLLLWHYRGGPWERAATFPLTGDPA